MKTMRDRSASGLHAKRVGDTFEDLFETACVKNKVACTRIPDGCKQIGNRRLIRVETPFDYVISFQGKSALLDTKTSVEAFPHSQIKEHQVRAMLEHQVQGTRGGYVIWVREQNKVVFIPALALYERSLLRGSIDADTSGVIQLGTIGDLNPRLIFS